MRKLSLPMFCAALLVAVASTTMARADDVKPVAVVSLSGYDNVMSDIALAGELSGQPHLGVVAEGLVVVATKGQGLEGLDKTRPWGVLIGTDGAHIGGCAFVPVSDLDKLMDVAKAWGGDRIQKHDDGTYEIQTHHKPLFVQETHKGWAFIVDNREILGHVPENPAKFLAGLNQRYDVAVRVYVANVPQEHREKFRAMMEKRFEKMAERRAEKHGQGCHCPMNEEMAAHMRKQMKETADDIDHVTVGWRLDNDLKQGVLEMAVDAKKGTKTAEHFAKLGAMRTEFGGFTLPEAAISGRITSVCDAPPAEHLDKGVEKMREHIHAKIEGKGKSEEEAKAAKEIVDTLLDVMKRTAASGRNDGAMAVALEDDALAMIAGRYVADGPKLESAVKMAVEQISKKHPECVEKILQLDANRYRGVNLHVATIPITDKCPRKEQAVEAVGENLTIVLGFGPKAVYLAAGRDAMRSLLYAIADSQESRRWTVPPMEFTMDLEEIVEFAEDFGPCCANKDAEKFGAALKKANAALEKAQGRDDVRVVVSPTRQGMKMRMELDEGVLRVMSSMKPHHRAPHKKHAPRK